MDFANLQSQGLPAVSPYGHCKYRLSYPVSPYLPFARHPYELSKRLCTAESRAAPLSFLRASHCCSRSSKSAWAAAPSARVSAGRSTRDTAPTPPPLIGLGAGPATSCPCRRDTVTHGANSTGKACWWRHRTTEVGAKSESSQRLTHIQIHRSPTARSRPVRRSVTLNSSAASSGKTMSALVTPEIPRLIARMIEVAPCGTD